jgi:hypothetical protein
VVEIDLEAGDDAQVIFETLNARGEPLLPADLLRNSSSCAPRGAANRRSRSTSSIGHVSMIPSGALKSSRPTAAAP